MCKWIVLVMFTGVLISSEVNAFDSKIDCNQLIDVTVPIKGQILKESSLQTFLTNYTTNGKLNETEKYYAICFKPDVEFKQPITAGFTLTTKLDADGNPIPLLIYGLNLSASASLTAPLITFSGSNIICDHCTVAGSGTGIKIDAKDVTIDTATISKFATAIETTSNSEKATIKAATISDGGIILAGTGHKIESSTLTNNGTGIAIQVNASSPPPSPTGGEGVTIQSTAITNFATGINVAKDASVKLAKNTFTITDPANAVVFDSSVASPIDSTLVGKKVSETDTAKVESVTGKLNLDSCAGSVEMYYKSSPAEGINALQFYSTATCQVSTLKDEDVEITFAN